MPSLKPRERDPKNPNLSFDSKNTSIKVSSLAFDFRNINRYASTTSALTIVLPSTFASLIGINGGLADVHVSSSKINALLASIHDNSPNSQSNRNENNLNSTMQIRTNKNK